MPALTFEDFWFKISVRHRIVLMDGSHKRPRSAQAFEESKERLSLMLTSLDGRIGKVLVESMYHESHTLDLFDIFTMGFAGCRPLKLEDTYDWIYRDQAAPIYHKFFCMYDGHSPCTRLNVSNRNWSNDETGFQVDWNSRETGPWQKPELKSGSSRVGRDPGPTCVSAGDTNSPDDTLKLRLQKLPQEIYDEIKNTLFDVTLGPGRTSLTGKLYPNVLRAFNREFYCLKRGTWLSSKLWTTFPHYPMRDPRDAVGHLVPLSIRSQLRKEVKQLSVVFDWSGLCQGCLAWLDSYYFKQETYPMHWLPHENRDPPYKNIFDVAIDYLEDVKAANAEILESWVHELSAIHHLDLDVLVLDTRSAYNYSGQYIGLDVVKDALQFRSHSIGTLVVKAPNDALKKEILEALEEKRSASMQWW